MSHRAKVFIWIIVAFVVLWVLITAWQVGGSVSA